MAICYSLDHAPESAKVKYVKFKKIPGEVIVVDPKDIDLDEVEVIEASNALKAYDFATDNRIVSFVSSASVASSVSLADPTDSTEDEVSEIDGNSVAKQSDSKVTDGEAEVDTDYSEVDSNASADANSAENSEYSNSTLEPSSDDLYYSDSTAA